MKPGLVIWGAGGAAKVVADTARLLDELEVAGFLDDANPERKGDTFCEASILGGKDQIPALLEGDLRLMVIAIGDNRARAELAAHAEEQGFQLVTLIHPTAYVAKDVLVDRGTVIKAGAVVESGAQIGANVIIGAQVYVGHEVVIKDDAHISGGGKVGGKSVIECGAWIGLGAVVKDRVHIGKAAQVAAGAVVLDDIPPGVVATGNPAVPRWRSGLFNR